MIYNWLNDETSIILINMIKKRINTKEKLSYVKLPNMKLINFINERKIGKSVINIQDTIIIDQDSKIHYPTDLSKQMEGIQEQITNHIIKQTRENKLNQIL